MFDSPTLVSTGEDVLKRKECQLYNDAWKYVQKNDHDEEVEQGRQVDEGRLPDVVDSRSGSHEETAFGGEYGRLVNPGDGAGQDTKTNQGRAPAFSTDLSIFSADAGVWPAVNSPPPSNLPLLLRQHHPVFAIRRDRPTHTFFQ